jgi:tetratricopeptide (TPR) repeat protein
MKEFIDKQHPTTDDYFRIMERFTGENAPYIISRLKKLIQRDPDYFEPYSSLSELHAMTGNVLEAEKVLNNAYKRALKRILDEKGQWPDVLKWDVVENRHLIRALLNKAILYWNYGKNQDALNLLRKLLRSNPNNNIVTRFFILAIQMKMSHFAFERQFNKYGFYDSDLTAWFDKNYRAFPDEFDWWHEEIEKFEE